MNPLQAKVFQNANGYFLTMMVYLGDKLGLFKDIAFHGASTVKEIASRTNTNERYIKEWICGMVSGGYVEIYTSDGHNCQTENEHACRYYLTNEQREVLANDGGELFLGGTIQMAVGCSQVVDNLLKAFKSGGGVKYSEYPPDLWIGMERHTELNFRNQLIKKWLPLLNEDRVLKKLRDCRTRVCDIGCGRGKGVVALAKAHPSCSYFAYDIFEPSLDRAREVAREAGVTVQFEKIGAEDTVLPSKEKFDIVFVFDVIHDAADPLRLAKLIRNSLKDDGILVCLDIKCSKDPKANCPFAYGVSLFYCMTTSLAQSGVGLGTCGLTEDVVQKLFVQQAGFSSVRRVDLGHPLDELWEVLP